MAIARGTTPLFHLMFPAEVDFGLANNIYVTFSRADTVITKKEPDILVTHTSIDVRLTQKETLMLGTGTVDIQVNWTYSNGLRAASSVISYEFSRQLLTEVIE